MHDPEEENDRIYTDMNAKKRRILDCVLDTIPDKFKTKAKRFCDMLKCRDRLFISPTYVM